VAVAINKDGPDHDELLAYLDQEQLPVLLSIPLRRQIAEAYSKGVPLVEALPDYGGAFAELLDGLERLVTKGAR
jgi:MinD superfamily P-loop ATPase